MALIKRVDITNGQWMTWIEITPARKIRKIFYGATE
jgi:hypothetical protein